jgi:hypothetical protein
VQTPFPRAFTVSRISCEFREKSPQAPLGDALGAARGQPGGGEGGPPGGGGGGGGVGARTRGGGRPVGTKPKATTRSALLTKRSLETRKTNTIQLVAAARAAWSQARQLVLGLDGSPALPAGCCAGRKARPARSSDFGVSARSPDTYCVLSTRSSSARFNHWLPDWDIFAASRWLSLYT